MKDRTKRQYIVANFSIVFTSIAILKNVEWDCTWEDSMNQLLFGISKND